jgi:uncharacterized protein YyaL (SSP411 family)
MLLLASWFVAPPAWGIETARVPESLPGAPPFSAALRLRLEQELARRGPEYVPRTQHRRQDGSPVYTNRLLLEASPYLRQHAHNPVSWHPWGEEAFALARELDRPVLVSIGYSTCHWCHVMEEETFDDPEVAALLNAGFVAIKVDREVRPDVDAVYMSAAHALGERGGWPLNVWLTPDQRPFHAGTYFPPEARGGRPGFRDVLARIRASYSESRGGVEQRAAQVTEAVRRDLAGAGAAASSAPDASLLDEAFERYRAGFDDRWGGLRGGTKFPASLPIRFLLRHHRRTGDEQALAMALLTLEQMAAGGLRDHLAGGFHRYTVEPRWLVPHFEKMLYDNALLLRAYTEAWQASGRADLREVVRQTVEYVARDMRAPSGVFYSATDADSAGPSGEMEEGRFYTWTPTEIRALLPAPAAWAAIVWYGVRERGELEGRNVLHAWRTRESVAAELVIAPERLDVLLEEARAGLLRARGQRPPPLRDEKVLVAWNGLMISALAHAGFALDEPRWIALSSRAADALLAQSVRKGRLSRVAGSDASLTPALLEDHAFLVAALLDLYELDGEPRWLDEALRVQGWQEERFADAIHGGYFRTAHDGEALLAREKPIDDGAIPSGNSVAALNLLRLHALTTDPIWLERAGMLFSAFDPVLRDPRVRVAELLLALDFALEPTREIALVTRSERPRSDAFDALLRPLRDQFVPNRVVVVAREGDDVASRSARLPWLAEKRALGGRPTAYVCIEQVCDFPTSDPERFSSQLAEPLHAIRDSDSPPDFAL